MLNDQFISFTLLILFQVFIILVYVTDSRKHLLKCSPVYAFAQQPSG